MRAFTKSGRYASRTGHPRGAEVEIAVSFIGHEDQAHFALIEKRVRMRLQRESIKEFELTGEPLPEVEGKTTVKGLRMSKKDKARGAVARKEGERG